MRADRLLSLLLAGALLAMASCTRCGCSAQLSAPASVGSAQEQRQGGDRMSFALKSTAFSHGGEIPKRYRCDGADISPALSWEDLPAGTLSLALIADDPDAPGGTWTHWLIWNISPQSAQLPEDLPAVAALDDGERQGKNDFQRMGYGGPCPPPGKTHRYFFKLYALDSRLDLQAGAARNELELAMKGHVLAQADWMGTYRR
jgi:hypothetical protein